MRNKFGEISPKFLPPPACSRHRNQFAVFWVAKAKMRPTSVTRNRDEICKAWNYTITVLAKFWGGFSAFLKYLGGLRCLIPPVIPTWLPPQPVLVNRYNWTHYKFHLMTATTTSLRCIISSLRRLLARRFSPYKQSRLFTPTWLIHMLINEAGGDDALRPVINRPIKVFEIVWDEKNHATNSLIPPSLAHAIHYGKLPLDGRLMKCS